MKPDEVCDSYADRGVRLSIAMLDETMILVEGDRTSLEFLAALIGAQACFDKDCGFSIDPNGAGSAFFVEGSKLGLYIHLTGRGSDIDPMGCPSVVVGYPSCCR